MSGAHLSAIHVLKAQLRLSDDEYRDLLQALTGKRSSAAMSVAERAKVRDHLQRQVARVAGASAPDARRPGAEAFAKAKAEASPRERKVWALWHQLHRDGLVTHTDRAALDAWVARTVQVSALRFCTSKQLDTCIEALKAWHNRAPAHGQAPAAQRAARAGGGCAR